MPWQCSRCSNFNPESSLFCSSCGQRHELNQQQNWFCGSCRQPNDPTARFCVRCGASAPASSPIGIANSVTQPVSFSHGAATPDFTMKAVITAVLYAVLWLPGVIANVLWWGEARKVKLRLGVSPSGYGCLLWMFILFVVLPLALIALVLVVLLLAGISLAGLFASHGIH